MSVRSFMFSSASCRESPSSISRKVRRSSWHTGDSKRAQETCIACSRPSPAATEMHMRSRRSGRSFCTASRRILMRLRSHQLGANPPSMGRTKSNTRPNLSPDRTAHQGNQSETEAEHGRPHLHSDELFGTDRSGESSLEQISMHPVDLARRVQPGQDVPEASCGRPEDASEQRSLHPLNYRGRFGEELGVGAQRANEFESTGDFVRPPGRNADATQTHHHQRDADEGNDVRRTHGTSIQILMLTMRRTIQKPSAIRPAVKMSTMSPAPCNMGSR